MNNDHPKLTIAGGVLAASVATALAVKRYFAFKDLKNEVDAIPWDAEKVTWKHYFIKYGSDSKRKPSQKA